MITDGKSWHYLTVKGLTELLRGISSNNKGDFDRLSCFHSYSIKSKLKQNGRVCDDHDYCYVEMPNKDNKILKCNYGEKSWKAPAIIYADLGVCSKKCIQVKMILRNLTQRKKLSIHLLVTLVYKLFIWYNKKQTWLLQRRRLYGKVL